jgi:acyl carrier protein
VDTAQLREQVREVMAGLFSVNIDEIRAGSSIQTVAQWDSLSHLNLLMALEQAFGIQIDTEDAVEMTSFEEVCQRLDRYLR